MDSVLDSKTLTEIIKKAAIEAVNAANPMDYCFGKVISSNPLKISLEQKLTLGRNQLDVAMSAGTLEVNDRVVLLKKRGGQKYLIISKAV